MQTSARAGSEAQYGHFHELVAPSFSLATAGAKVLFTTDVEGLNDLYLDALPASERQHHNCSCCRRFIRTYGGLVSIDDNGDTVPVMWSGEEIPDFYRPVFAALADRVAKAKVTGVFLSKERVWGAPEAGGFTHFAVEPPVALIFKERALTARQTMAKRKEDFKNVLAGLVDFKPALLDEAIRIFQVDDISRSEKFVGPLQWLRELHDRPKGSRGTNLLWRAIATAPEGFCHPRSAVTGTLLEDIAAGMSFDAVKRRFEAKVGPLAYQRPQADPTGGAIKAAEALVEKLGVQKSFERRFARLDELKLVWSPKAKEQPSGGMFGHLTPKNPGAVQPLNLPTQTMTWAKFVLNVLGSAEEIEIMVPPRGNFTGILTAEHADAPPILKWDHEEHRNPLSSYVYNGGSDASRWNLRLMTYAKLTGVTLQPNLYGNTPMEQMGVGVVLVIEGAVDSGSGQGNALFPEILKAELHGIRSVVEAYSKRAEIGGRQDASACGYGLGKGEIGVTLRVRSAGATMQYRIDRWD